MAKRKIHLVSNAHLDPVWLWEWQEGAGEALSTFRQAAEFCEKYEGLRLLPQRGRPLPLGRGIRAGALPEDPQARPGGKWHIMGGWYVQPDCNMPSGESFVRQVLLGRRYFREKFGVEPRTAVNLDPFGHTRGLVQILAKSGYTAYLCCRPGNEECPLPPRRVRLGRLRRLRGPGQPGLGPLLLGRRQGARAAREVAGGASRGRPRHPPLGHRQPRRRAVAAGPARPGRADGASARTSSSSTRRPTPISRELEAQRAALPRREKDLNPWAVGCYTSMARVKQGHRRLENELYSAEKMATTAWLQGLMPYPHDATSRRPCATWPSSSSTTSCPVRPSRPARRAPLRHDRPRPGDPVPAQGPGLFRPGRGRAQGGGGRDPRSSSSIPTLTRSGRSSSASSSPGSRTSRRPSGTRGSMRRARRSPRRPRRRTSNLSVEWRKRVVFEAELAPGRLNRFACRLERAPDKPAGRRSGTEDGAITLRDRRPRVVGQHPDRACSTSTGPAASISSSRAAFAPLVIRDNADPWGMKVRSFRTLEGRVRPGDARRGGPLLRDPRRRARAGARHRGRRGPHGRRGHPLLRGTRASASATSSPSAGTEIEIEVRVFWAERDRDAQARAAMPKLRAPRFMGQVAYGADELPSNGDEAVAQKWLALVSETDGAALTVVNDGIYGSDWNGGELRLSLLRSPAYAADTWEDRLAVARDRFIPRQDTGERIFRFWLNGGPLDERLESDRPRGPGPQRSALRPGLLPAGRREAVAPRASSSKARPSRSAAFKRSEDGRDVVVRLFEPTGKPRAGRGQAPGLRGEDGGPARGLRGPDPPLRPADEEVRRDRPSREEAGKGMTSKERVYAALEGTDPRPGPLRRVRRRLRHGRAPPRPRDLPPGQGQVPDRLLGGPRRRGRGRAGSRTTSPCSRKLAARHRHLPHGDLGAAAAGRADPPPRRIDADDLGGPATAGSTSCRRRRRTSPASTTRSGTRRVFTAAEFEKEPEPPRRDERSWKILDAVIQEFKGEKFICGPSGGSVGIVLLGGMERGLLELAANPDAVRAATRLPGAAAEPGRRGHHPSRLRRGACGPRTSATRPGPLIGPAIFRDLFLEANKERARNVKGRYGKKILKHCCGNINLLMDFFVDIGFDAYQSIQPTAGMDICRLKKDYGDRIALWGGVAVEHLVGGTPDDVRADVRRAMACAKPGGRFILGASHSVAVGTKYDNYMALLDEHARTVSVLARRSRSWANPYPWSWSASAAWARSISRRSSKGRTTGLFRIAGAVDPQPNRCKQYVEMRAMGVPCFVNLPDFYRNRKADLAVLSSPIQLHMPQISFALAKGSHVLCEKPAAGTIQEVRAGIAAEKGVGALGRGRLPVVLQPGRPGPESGHPVRALRRGEAVQVPLSLAPRRGLLREERLGREAGATRKGPGSSTARSRTPWPTTSTTCSTSWARRRRRAPAGRGRGRALPGQRHRELRHGGRPRPDRGGRRDPVPCEPRLERGPRARSSATSSRRPSSAATAGPRACGRSSPTGRARTTAFPTPSP